MGEAAAIEKPVPRREKVEFFLPPLEGPDDAAVAAAKAVLKAREKAVEEQGRRTLLKCRDFIATGKGCGSLHAVADTVYIQSHWYESPHGCTGGDMWHAGEGGWICPSCGHENRLYETPEIEKLKPLFRKTEDRYQR